MKRTPIPILLILLSSCTMVGPDYVKHEPAAPTSWSQSTDGIVTEPAQDISHWWKQLQDPLLTSLIDQTLLDSPDLKSAKAKLLAARARRDLADNDRFPTVKASGSANRSRSSAVVGSGTTTNLFNAGFDASWEPDVFGGLSRAVEAAEADLGASQADFHAIQVTLVAEVALNYVELRSFQSRLNIAHDNLATQSETLQITDWRAQAGLATELEVEQARTNREQTLATIPGLNTNLVEAENRLAILLGKFPGTLHDPLAKTVPLPTLPDQIAVGIPADTLRQRPDVRAAERKLAAETARVGEESAALYPGFNLSGNLGWKALTLGALGGPGAFAGSLIGNISQTLFDAGRIRNRIKIQSALQEQALSTYEKTVLTALEDVENALTAYANSRARQAALRQAAKASRNAASLARQRYESGIIDFQKVLDTERTRLSTEDTLASAEAEGISSLISLYKALGGGWTEMPEIVPEMNTQAKTESSQP